MTVTDYTDKPRDVFYDGVADIDADHHVDHETYTPKQIAGFLKKRFAAVNVEFGNRWLVVTWDKWWKIPDDTAGEEYPSESYVSDLLEERYHQWMCLDEYPEAEDYCCEEWILEGINSNRWFSYRGIYVSEFELADPDCDLEYVLRKAKEGISNG